MTKKKIITKSWLTICILKLHLGLVEIELGVPVTEWLTCLPLEPTTCSESWNNGDGTRRADHTIRPEQPSSMPRPVKSCCAHD